MKAKKITIIATLLLAVSNVGAQSLDRVKSLLEQGHYKEAAVMLRPLADGGNAEAQYIAAKLFYYGYGVNANEAQGKKYATLAADQGNEDAILLLLKKSKSPQTYQLAKKYTDQHPYLKKGEVGIVLAECYLRGTLGTPKNEVFGWDIIEQSNLFDQLMQDNKKVREEYYNYKMRQAGKTCIEDYADYLFKTGSNSRYNMLVTYIEDVVYNSSAQQLKMRAESGIPWAMARLAKVYDEQGYESTAKSWAQKAVDAGSEYGRAVMEKYNYVPVTYTNISADSSPRYTKIEKVTQEWDKTVIQLKFTNYQGYEWVYTDPGTTITCNGKEYKMISSTLPLRANEKRITYNETVYYTMVFEGIPHSARVFNLNQGSWKWTNVRFR